MAAVKFNKTLIVVIAVSGLAACVATLFLIFKFYHRPSPVPLPPIQPLAYHRERVFKSFPYPYIPRKGTRLDRVGSYESSTFSSRPSRMPSFQTDRSSGTLSSSYRSFPIPPSPPTNVFYPSGLPSASSHSDEHASVTYPRPASQYRSRLHLSHKNSTSSMCSTFTYASTRSANTIRGAPHSPHSDIQIILPTPLAPQLQNHMVVSLQQLRLSEFSCESCGVLAGQGGTSVDRWMAAPSRTTSHRSLRPRPPSQGGTTHSDQIRPPRLPPIILTMDKPHYPILSEGSDPLIIRGSTHAPSPGNDHDSSPRTMPRPLRSPDLHHSHDIAILPH